jgi:hypothetical protein
MSLARPRDAVHHTLIALLLASLLAACGDAVVFFSFTSGTVASEPICGNGNGRFDFRDQQGLILVVLIDSDTSILAANGRTAQCTDIAPGDQVQVGGRREASTISAQSIEFL